MTPKLMPSLLPGAPATTKTAGANLKISAVITRQCMEGLSPLQRHPFFLERTETSPAGLRQLPLTPALARKHMRSLFFILKTKLYKMILVKLQEKKVTKRRTERK